MIEQRRTQRFELRLPLEVVRSGSERLSKAGETRNLSSVGVLFTSEAGIDIGEPIEYVITLTPRRSARETVSLRCMGKVVRLEPLELPAAARPFEVAATLERYEFIRQKP